MDVDLVDVWFSHAVRAKPIIHRGRTHYLQHLVAAVYTDPDANNKKCTMLLCRPMYVNT